MSVRQRLRYGATIARALAGVGWARVRRTTSRVPSRPAAGWTRVFDRSTLAALAREKIEMEAFDLYLYGALNDSRLCGQIVFEYGTLANWRRDWRGLRVLDVGTGRSTLPCWMAAQGARAIAFDLPQPHERRIGGTLGRVNERFLRQATAGVRVVGGSMRQLPFRDASFDLVTCLSVLEHLDTDLPDRRYVPYAEQTRRLRETLDEMVRVTRRGGHLYVTSECCDFTRATSDSWRSAYYYDDGPALSAAWPAGEVRALFHDHLAARGCAVEGEDAFRPELVDGSPERSTGRGAFFGAFSVLVRRDR
jgi:hypothetical protein